MATRKEPFITGEHYHILNRGVDKRDIFGDQEDLDRFFQSINEFNTLEPIGSIYENSRGGSTATNTPDTNIKLVAFVSYCLNPNHYHFILQQMVDGGISEFMKRLGGYTWYFNNKYKRSGSLFQGRFKSVHIDSNEQLLHTSVYVNLNDRVHSCGGSTATGVANAGLTRSSWREYMEDYITEYPENTKNVFCKKDIILDQFRNKNEYKSFAEESLEIIKENKMIQKLLIE